MFVGIVCNLLDNSGVTTFSDHFTVMIYIHIFGRHIINFFFTVGF
uniref:Uncharacterized protein n=1 Tax=Anguilla anguilla TaxID=7936 RepID=A0A0E9XT51_ANGAN